MRCGVSFPSYAAEAAWVDGGAGSWTAGYEPSVLSDLLNPRRVALQSGTGSAVLDFTLPAARSVQFFALVHHNGEATSSFQLQLSTGTTPGSNVVYDSGSIATWPAGSAPGSGYPAVRPLILPSAVSIQCGRLTLSTQTVPWEIGAIELSGWWNWGDYDVDRELGIESRSVGANMADGVTHVTRQWSPRRISGRRTAIDLSEVEGTLLDFQLANGRHKPFVWVGDWDDATKWTRHNWLARMRSLPAGVTTSALAGDMPFDFIEHLG